MRIRNLIVATVVVFTSFAALPAVAAPVPASQAATISSKQQSPDWQWLICDLLPVLCPGWKS